jgi:methyl-accepting chemotaxis protein
MTNSWTFGQKLALVFGVLVLLSIVIVAVSSYSLNRAVASSEFVISTTVENLVGAERLRANALDKANQVRGFLLTGDADFERGILDAEQMFQATVSEIRGRVNDDGLQLAATEQAMAAYQREIDSALEIRRANADIAQINATFGARLAPAFQALDGRIGDLVAQERLALDRTTKTARDDAALARALMLGFGGASIIAAVLLATLLVRALTQQIGGSVQHVRSSSAELHAAAAQQASGAKEQATAMNEISTTITELLTTSRQIADSSQRVAKVAEDTAIGAAAGRTAVREAEQSIGNIRHQVDAIVRHMLDLGKKSQQIGGIVAIINELAEQTNILAINATIEAAGAGEAGKRFAVVGDEVRKLAERVGGSAKQVETLVQEVREAVNATVMVTESGSKAVDAGGQSFGRLTVLFDGIGKQVDTTKEVAREIELSTKQQTTAVEQVNVAITDVAQATREAEAGSSQTVQTASQLSSLSDQLMRLIRATRPAHA